MKRLVLIGSKKPILAAMSTAALLVVGIGCGSARSSEGRYILIDGGAHRGEVIELFETTTLFAQYPWDIYAIEANPNLIENLRRWDNITIIDQAMSTSDGTVELFLGEMNDRLGSLYNRARRLKPEPIRVKSFDFSQWIETNFSLDDFVILSLDIQGGEYPVLEKMLADSTMQYIDRMYVDFHPEIALRTVTEHLDVIQQIIDAGVFVHYRSGEQALRAYGWIDTLLDPPTLDVPGVDFVDVGAPVPLEAEATVRRGGPRVEWVEFLVDGAGVGVDREVPYEGTWMARETGRHLVTATAHDSAGNVAVSAPVTVFVGLRALERSIARSEDDAEERPDGSMQLTSSDLDLEDDRVVGLRFVDIRIPRGAQIASADVQFTAQGVDTEPTDLVIQAELAANGQAFGPVDHDLSSRTRTSASVTWSPEPWEVAGERSVRQRTPDLAALIQEVVDRPDWHEGSALVLLTSGSGDRDAWSYEGAGDRAPRLYIELADNAASPGSVR